jgi:hypothetical protein
VHECRKGGTLSRFSDTLPCACAFLPARFYFENEGSVDATTKQLLLWMRDGGQSNGEYDQTSS